MIHRPTDTLEMRRTELVKFLPLEKHEAEKMVSMFGRLMLVLLVY
jgi:hypothetical protein